MVPLILYCIAVHFSSLQTILNTTLEKNTYGHIFQNNWNLWWLLFADWCYCCNFYIFGHAPCAIFFEIEIEVCRGRKPHVSSPPQDPLWTFLFLKVRCWNFFSKNLCVFADLTRVFFCRAVARGVVRDMRATRKSYLEQPAAGGKFLGVQKIPHPESATARQTNFARLARYKQKKP